MPRLRFETAQDLFETYPTARVDVGVAARGQPSIDFMRSLSADSLKAALSFCAYLLARREAVAWGCQCLREGEALQPHEENRLAAAEAWASAPDEPRRLRALDLASRGEAKEAGTWTCFAVGWSGGAVAIDGQHFAPAPHQATAQAVRVALILGANALSGPSRQEMQRRWLEAGIQFALR